jgi:predicted nucleotidyltransferase
LRLAVEGQVRRFELLMSLRAQRHLHRAQVPVSNLQVSAIISSMPGKKFVLPRKEIAEFCKRWGITEFSVFGSVLRDDFRPDSDIDVLVSIDPKAHIGLFEIAQMQIELEKIFKRSVDLVEKEGLRNPYRREEILRTAKVIYAAG